MTLNENLEYIDQQLWKTIQDKFSKVTGLPVITLDNQGNTISQSGNYPFFCQIVRNTKEGDNRCKNCQKDMHNKIMQNEKNIGFYNCHAGLSYIMAPITVNDRKIGSVMVPSQRSRTTTIHLSRVGQQIECEPLELIDAYKNIHTRSKEDMIRFGSLMLILSQTIPVAVHEKFIATKKVNQLLILQKISHRLVSTLDLEKSAKSLLQSIKEEFKLKSTLVLFFDKARKKFCLDNEEISKEENESAIKVLLSNTESLSQYGTNYILSVPLIVNKDIVGVLNLYSTKKELLENDKEIFKIISDLGASAIVNCRQFNQINLLATTDKLTGLYNRQYLTGAFEKELERATKNQQPITVMLFDLDHFGSYNNEFGHLEGDTLLEVFAQILKTSFRERDIVARYGGEEFIVIMPNTYSKDAFGIAERIRNALENTVFLRKVTTSIGIACSMAANISQRKIIKAADDALYKSKEEGRNKTNVVEILADEDIKAISDLDSHVY